jgi:tetratricopeptide (TPR) repeat protein
MKLSQKFGVRNSPNLQDLKREALAEMGFAKCYDLFDNSDQAIDSLENSIKKAEGQDKETMRLISKELITIYKKLAEKYEVEAKDFDENIQAALGYYEKCLEVCRRAGEKELQGKISNKIGKIYFNHKMFEKSIEH